MKPMYRVSPSVLVPAFQHSLSKASTATLQCCVTHHPLLCSGPGGHTNLCWPSLEPRQLFKAKTVSASRRWFGLLQSLFSSHEVFNSFPTFPSSGENTFPLWRAKKPQVADHIGYVPSATLCPTALPLYTVSTFSIGSCFLAAALR